MAIGISIVYNIQLFFVYVVICLRQGRLIIYRSPWQKNILDPLIIKKNIIFKHKFFKASTIYRRLLNLDMKTYKIKTL